MQRNSPEPDHENLPQSQVAKTTPVAFSMACSLNATSDPVSLTEADKTNMNNVANVNDDGGDELGSKLLPNNAQERDDNGNTMTTPTMDADAKNDDKLMRTPLCAPCEISGGALKYISTQISSKNRESAENDTRRSNDVGRLKNDNNNYPEDLFMTAESKAIYPDKKLLYKSDSSNWKPERGANGDFDQDLRAQFPWKRIAYIGVLLVLGVTCAILAVMKLCGGADWMNTATFSVIIMGTVMLLPPGLYYARILICICFRCKGYTLWDVPQGPFG